MPDKTHWSKLMLPQNLNDMLLMIAKKQGYQRSDVYLFIYQMLKQLYPDDVEKLEAYLGREWLELDDKEEGEDL